MDSVHLAAWEYFLLTEIYQRCLLGFNLPCVPQLEGMDLQLPLVFSLLILSLWVGCACLAVYLCDNCDACHISLGCSADGNTK